MTDDLAVAGDGAKRVETKYKTFGDVAELQKRHQQELQELAQRQQAERKQAEAELMAYHRAKTAAASVEG